MFSINNKFLILFLVLSLFLLFASAGCISSDDGSQNERLSHEDYNKMSEAEQEEYDFQIFKKTMAEDYHQDVTIEDYHRIRAGTIEMIEASDADIEKYGKVSDEFNIAFSDHIFIGRVVKHNGNYQAQKHELPYPYNLYDVEIIELIKGPALKNEIELKQIGGHYTKFYVLKELIQGSGASLNFFEKYYHERSGFLESDDSLIEVGEVYLFITVTHQDGRCTIGSTDSRIHLEDFDTHGLSSLNEVDLYKKIMESDIKDFDRIRWIANEEV